MNNMINFGIDLGTTNSLIACFAAGKTEIYKNPSGHKETLPSVVAFRKDRVIVGDKAKEYIEKDPTNVFGGFKRKMGTGEQFFVADSASFKSPVELSALVLKELKNFVYTGETVDAAVITIPASFDTIQSNATKEAGYLAGFKEVVLLQEPIAASLAFANKQNAGETLSGQWLVYDLGGGTFDVALVRFEEEELRVADHEGDNYLGGLDFDNFMIEKIVVPKLESTGAYKDLWQSLRTSNGKHNKLYYVLLHKAEEAKIELSNRPETDIEFEIEDDNGDLQDAVITITRQEFEACIEPQVNYSIELTQNLLKKNRIDSSAVNEIIMIGGSTYIPYVRQQVEQRLGVKVNCSVDPTTAVAIGAAYFAGTRRKRVAAEKQEAAQGQKNINCKMAYAKTSRDTQEYFAASFSGDIDGLSYRILREDGGFDSGLKPISARISEMLPLLADCNNSFKLGIYDATGNTVPVTIPTIEITHGKFSIQGQPLPNDICIEVDDAVNKTTRLEVVFEKNNMLPLRKTIIREAGKIVKKDTDDSIIINVLEGNRYAMPSSNLPIGVIELKGKDLLQDLVKGSDIEIVLEINESRDLKVKVTLLMNDQEFSNLFTPSVRHISIDRLRGELQDLQYEARLQLSEAGNGEDYELAAELQKINDQVQQCIERVATMTAEDVTDEKYQLEERKRNIAKALDTLSKQVNLDGVIDDYLATRDYTRRVFEEHNDTARLAKLNKMLANEDQFLASQGMHIIKGKIKEMNRLRWDVEKDDPVRLINLFYYYNSLPENEFTDVKAAHGYIDMAEKAIERQNYKELLALIYRIDHLVIDKTAKEKFNGTGLN